MMRIPDHPGAEGGVASTTSRQRKCLRNDPWRRPPECLGNASNASWRIHALLSRRYTKGRDLFDLSWYLTRPDRPSPNFDLLRNALAQTGWRGPRVEPGTWRSILLERVTSLDWPAVLRDVEPFLEDPRDRQLLDRDLLLSELRRSGT